ncbi:MAG TPA: hypothetical protein ENK18_18420 [Deltaproteobacteria bacterium]|nr:hypothetical protein [Deltaproteobacteria bacterium]
MPSKPSKKKKTGPKASPRKKPSRSPAGGGRARSGSGRAPSRAGRASSRSAPRRASTRKKSPRGKRAAGRPASRRPSLPALPAPGSRAWLIAEILTWSAALLAGALITSGLLWVRARRDVTAYLSAPPQSEQSTIWSAPMRIEIGMPADPAILEDDLLAAGYERVEHLLDSDGVHGDRAGLFALSDGTFELWTSPHEPLPDGRSVTEGRTTITVADGEVRAISRPGGVTLPPTVLGWIGDPEVERDPVVLSELSRWVEPALLSMEDARFREHHGVDPIGIARALFANATSDRQQGGSTLTQQLAKNLFLSNDRTLRRKVREVFFAAALEGQLSKDELLELYLGEVYLGQMGGLPLHGFEAASRAWFGKSAGRLEVHEAALIVGVIPAPNAYSPIRHPELARERRDLVLQKMHELGKLDAGLLSDATERPVVLSGLEPSRIRRAPYAVDAAIERVEGMLGQGVLARGVHVHTTIHPLLQRAAEEAVAEGMAELDEDYPKAAGAQVALVAVRISDGSVAAMVGGRSYADSAYNRAMDAQRQVGSTIKPITLVKALDDGVVTPATRLPDEPLTVDLGTEIWTPKNYDGKFEGEVSLRRAIEASRNIPAIHLANQVGMVRLQRFYQSLGLSQATALPSAALGSFSATPVEMAGAYTMFHRGISHQPEVVDRVLTVQGDELLHLEPTSRAVVDERAAAQAMDLLRGVIQSGTGARARRYGVDSPAGGKTGTTDEYRDAWFVGLTPELAVAVWVGRDRGTLGLAGSRGALPTWARFVAASGTLSGQPYMPDGLERVTLCVETSLPIRKDCPERITELFIAGTAPDERCDEHGGPQVQIGRLFGNLFRRQVDDEQSPPSESSPAPSPRKERRRDRGRRRRD